MQLRRNGALFYFAVLLVQVLTTTRCHSTPPHHVSSGRALGHGTSIPPPSLLQLLFINSSAVQLSWDYPYNDTLPIKFRIQVSHDGDPYLNVSGLISEDLFVYNGMLFAAYYQFRVLAIFKGLVSEPADSDYFINGVTAPPGPPVHIQILLVSPSELCVQWDTPSTPTPPTYIVKWGEDPSNLDKEFQVYQITHAKFQNLEPGSSLYFRLRTDISGRQSVLSDWVNVTMPPPYLPAPVFINHTQSTEWVWLSWSVPAKQRRLFNYQISNFTLCFSNGPTDCAGGILLLPPLDSPCKCEMIPHMAMSSNVTDLNSNTTYYLHLKYSSTDALDSLWSRTIVIATLSEEPRLLCLSCEPLSATQLLLGWSFSGAASAHTLIVRPYNVSATQNTSSAILAEVSGTFSLPKAGNVTVNNLHPWTFYPLALTINEVMSVSPASCPVASCWTSESVPSTPPSDITIINITSRTVTLQVTPPPLDAINGRLVGYVAKVSCQSEDNPDVKGKWKIEENTSLCYHGEVYKLKNWSSLTSGVLKFAGLSPATNYSLWIAAATGSGEGPYSSETTFVTKKEVSELSHFLQLQVVHKDSTHADITSSTDNCSHVLELSWVPSFSYEGSMSSHLRNVTFSSYSVISLISRFCLSTTKTHYGYLPVRSCIVLPGAACIVQPHLNLSLLELQASRLGALLPAGGNGVVWVWLYLEVWLSNGTMLEVTSKSVKLNTRFACATNTGKRSTIDTKIAVLSSIIPLVFVAGVAASICVTCVFKKMKKNPTNHASEVMMERYCSPRAVRFDYALLRAGDGRSSNSSSTPSTTSGTGSEEPDVGEDLSDASSVPSLDTVTSCRASLLDVRSATGAGLYAERLGRRPSPDGCSVSSDSGSRVGSEMAG